MPALREGALSSYFLDTTLAATSCRIPVFSYQPANYQLPFSSFHFLFSSFHFAVFPREFACFWAFSGLKNGFVLSVEKG